jgi:predicted ribosomally synthesized peptide with SipW-like signal peptide
MSKNLKRYLMLLAVIGLVAVGMGGSGTFASFNAEVANQGNYFATGTLFLHNTNGSTTCTSESASNNLNTSNTGDSCATLFTVNPLLEGSAHTAQLRLANAGSVNATDIKFALGATCADTTPTITTLSTGFNTSDAITTLSVSAIGQALVDGTKITVDDGVHAAQTFTMATTANSGATSLDVVDTTANNILSSGAKITITQSFGGGSLCSGLQVYVQETASDYSTNLGCAYGNSASPPACDYNGSFPLSGIGTSFNTLSLASAGSGNSGTDLTAGKSRYFVIGVKAPASFTNTYQNDQVKFDLKWHIDQ